MSVSGGMKRLIQIIQLPTPYLASRTAAASIPSRNCQIFDGSPDRGPGSQGRPQRTLGSCERPAAAESTGLLIRGLSVSVAGVRRLPI
jgi:hypothetical protein